MFHSLIFIFLVKSIVSRAMLLWKQRKLPFLSEEHRSVVFMTETIRTMPVEGSLMLQQFM